MAYKPDYLDAKQSYIDQAGRPTPQLMIFWQKFMNALSDAINGLAAVTVDVATLVSDVLGLKAVPFLTVGNSATTSAERALVPMPGDLVGTDGGANSNYALGLAATAVVAGTYGDGTNIPRFIVDAKGRLVSAENVPVAIGVSYVPLSMGTEPLTFVSDGAGQPVLVPFTP